ncbi:MAG: cytochrome c family protein [Pseudomonadota bacterium]
MIKNFLCQNKLLLQNTAKNIGLFLGFGLSALLVSVLISYLLYQPKKMVKRGFEVEIKTATQDVGGVKTGNLGAAKPDAKSAAAVDIATMIKNADIDAGAKVFKKCATCHTVNQGGANKIGPNLYGIIGRKKASIAGFTYSPALKAKSGAWTIEDLNIWLTNPKAFVPGTKMGFAGLKKDKDRANVIAYLKQGK